MIINFSENGLRGIHFWNIGGGVYVALADYSAMDEEIIGSICANIPMTKKEFTAWCNRQGLKYRFITT